MIWPLGAYQDTTAILDKVLKKLIYLDLSKYFDARSKEHLHDKLAILYDALPSEVATLISSAFTSYPCPLSNASIKL